MPASLLLKTTCTLGLATVSGGVGFGLGEGVAGNWLAEQLPSVFRTLLPSLPPEPNHDLTRAFHAAVRDTLIHATGQRNPLKAFQQAHAAEWNTLHTGQRAAIKAWLADLQKAAQDHEAAGQSPLIPLDDATLKTLAEDRTGEAIQDLQRQLRAALRQRLAQVQNQSDAQADRAAALFIDWFSRQLGTQLSVHFWEQLKTDEKARTAYFGLVAQAMQQLLSEVAQHAVSTREELEKLSREQQQRYLTLATALATLQQAQADAAAAHQIITALISTGQEKLEQALTRISTQLSRMDQSIQQLVDGTQPALYQAAQAAGTPRRIISVNDLNYKSRLIPFQSRPIDTARLEDFLHSQPAFAWWAIIGPGGMGKSRLAQEIIQQRLDAGWQAGFLGSQESDWLKQTHKSWQPAFPTLIVIDYASDRATHLLPLLASLQQRQASLRQPVRVLLLDRPGFLGALFSDVFARPDSDDHARRLSLAALWQPAAAAPPQQIEIGRAHV